ncbi:MAG: ATP-binding protein, partial [Candidatus Micrarchaeota archaeon]
SVDIKRLLLADKENEDYNQKLNDVIRRLNDTNRITKNAYEFFVLNRDGIIVASSTKEDIGKDKSGDSYFLGAGEGAFITDAYVSQDKKINSIAFSAPVFDEENIVFSGVVAARVSMAEINKIVEDRTGLGKTGEIYLVNKYGYMITPSLFVKDTFLKQKVDTEDIRRRLADYQKFGSKPHPHKFPIYRNYRGVKVLGVYDHIPRMGWGLLAEIDEKEALAPLAVTKLLFIIICCAGMVIVWIVGTLVSRVITAPIHKLHRGAEIIGQGNLDYKVGTNAKDEIGQLSRAFDQMTKDLKKTTTSIDELNATNQQLAASQQQLKAANQQLCASEQQLKAATKQLQASETRYRTLYESSKDAIMTLAPPSWKFTSGNPATFKLFGTKSEAECVSLGPWELSPEYQPDGELSSVKTKKMIEKAMKEGTNFFEWTHKKVSGEEFPATVLLTRMELEGKKLLQATVRDITKSKKAEEALRILNRELKLSAKKLEKSNRELQDFVYIASHDLREPLRKISSFGQMLKDSLGGNLSKDDQENLGFMIDGAHRMQEMVDGILTYSRAGTNSFSFEAVDLNEIVEHLEQVELAELLEETGATIEVQQSLPKVEADLTGMRQLLQNLIANGVKYRRDEIRPRIVIRAKQIDNDKVRIEVQDNGIGIKQEYHNDIFTMFRRLHSRQKYEGMGIGLAVCKKIVERHNGQIGVESKYGEGATFWFTISAANEAIAANEMVREM